MTHTPTPWETRKASRPVDGAYDWAIGAQVDESGRYCIGELVGRAAEDVWLPAEENVKRVIAAVNFFHGRDIPTDRIPEGGFWEMVRELQYNLKAWKVVCAEFPELQAPPLLARDLEDMLAKLGIEP